MKTILITPDNKRDYTTELTVEGLSEVGCDILASSCGNGIRECHSDKRLIEESKTSDFIIGFFGKVRGNSPPKNHLLPSLGDVNRRAFIDGSEWTYTANPEPGQVERSLVDPGARRGSNWIDEWAYRHVSKYFKRETYPVDVSRGIIPLPFALSKRHITQVKEKDIDVFCVFGQLRTGLRSKVYQHCLKLSESGKYKMVVSTSLPHVQYLDLISRSRIVIDAWGGGDNCDRFYEAIGSRACCLYQGYNTIVPDPYVDFQTAVSYKSTDQFAERLSVLLNDKKLTQLIGESGFEHAQKYHSVGARAKFIIDTICG